MPDLSVCKCRSMHTLKACVQLPPFLCPRSPAEEASWPRHCVVQTHVVLPDYEVLHPFALGSLCFVLPGLPRRTEGGEGCWLEGFWLLPPGSEPGNVLNGRCVPSAACLSSKQLFCPRSLLRKHWALPDLLLPALALLQILSYCLWADAADSLLISGIIARTCGSLQC